MKNVKENFFDKQMKTINECKVKYETKQENVKETKNDFKENRFTDTNREDVNLIKVNDTSKYDHSGD